LVYFVVVFSEEHSETEAETPKKQTRMRRKQGATAQKENHPKSLARPAAITKQAAGAATALAALANLEMDETTASTSSLFAQVFLGQCAMQSLVDDWIESYKKDANAAILDLMRFVVRSSGCRGQLSNTSNRDMLKTKEFTEAINELIESFNEDENGATNTEQYPLIQSSVHARKFKSNFCEFIQLLINQCQYSIVYDQFMLDIFITFLIALADSQVRAFRHTATLAVLKIMTALVDVLLSLSISKV
jgi:cohesin complex subunit SA-1/2